MVNDSTILPSTKSQHLCRLKVIVSHCKCSCRFPDGELFLPILQCFLIDCGVCDRVLSPSGELEE